MKRRYIVQAGVALCGAIALSRRGITRFSAETVMATSPSPDHPGPAALKGTFEITKTDEEWRQILSPEAFRVLRQHGTEWAGSSPLNQESRSGTYHCAGCDSPLFSSKTKYDSQTGWPSFYAPLDAAVGTSKDYKLNMKRTEVHCARCGGHLGHVFLDGPPPTGQRYCINGVALNFKAS